MTAPDATIDGAAGTGRALGVLCRKPDQVAHVRPVEEDVGARAEFI
jgi:hypothetical protein